MIKYKYFFGSKSLRQNLGRTIKQASVDWAVLNQIEKNTIEEECFLKIKIPLVIFLYTLIIHQVIFELWSLWRAAETTPTQILVPWREIKIFAEIQEVDERDTNFIKINTCFV